VRCIIRVPRCANLMWTDLVDNCGGNRRCDKEPPFYEHYGQKQVAAGHYHRVLRYDEHIAPLAEALWRYAEGST
ncbi:MAG: hypothetical protein ACREOH_16680, partial [Candidatus Entotheonellia bacterium]